MCDSFYFHGIRDAAGRVGLIQAVVALSLQLTLCAGAGEWYGPRGVPDEFALDSIER
jgi:hypothetical protein